MPEDYDEHLTTLHSAWTTPPDTVALLVGEVAATEIVDMRRVVHGEANEVYDVTLRRAPSLIVRIAHGGADALEREAWVLGECAVRGIAAPRVHSLRHMEIDGKHLAAILMDKIEGDRLCDLELPEATLRQVLGEVGEWLRALHAIPVRGFGYLDRQGACTLPTIEAWLDVLTSESSAFERAGLAVGLAPETIRSWLDEIVDACRASPLRVALIHNDLLARHVLVREGRLAGIIDFGEVAAEPVANEFAKWDFCEGDRFPVEWIQHCLLYTSPSPRD